MQITGVFPFAYRHYIAFEGLDALKDALRIFSTGQTKGGHATRDKLASEGGIGGAFVVTYGINRDDDQFLTELFAEIDERVGPRGRRKKMPKVGTRLNKSYDYGGPGAFFKSIVDVTYAGENIFLLGLNAAYVGNQVEIGLAEYLGLDRCVMRTGVRLDIEPTGETFNFDLDVIANGLIAAELDVPEHFRHIDGGVLAALMEAARGGGTSIITGDDDFILEMGFVGIEEPWERNGATITGSLYNMNWHSEDKPVEWATPSITLTFKRNTPGSRYAMLPITDPAILTKLNTMTSAIENSFK